MAKKNYSVARLKPHSRDDIGKYERHNERKNESYGNMNVDLSRTQMNVSYKNCGDLTYNQYLDKLIEEGKVSLRGLKEDSKVFDELLLDVNSDYFEQHGGYEYAKQFYEDAFHFAEKTFGSQNIISAVMHADEINVAATENYGHPVYHYHLHVVALPVVEKEIRWTKRCKDPALVGTVKEVIQQVSHSKKWKSEKLLDENGNPVYKENGDPVLVKSYSILQDKFFEYMSGAGYEDFVRGERGSTAENLTPLQYKISKDQERLSELEQKIADEQIRYDSNHGVYKTYYEIEHMGKKSLTGKITIPKEDFDALTKLAKEGIGSRSRIMELEDKNARLSQRIWTLQGSVNRLQSQLDELREICQPYLDALKRFPDKVKAFFEELLKPKEKPQEKTEPTSWDGQIPHRKKPKSRGDWER
ncbi:MAG: plasmid recombination protein [Clostridiales bacterium]|nr:plasmid recombination protein [Candidatus Cacconaster stercorequi]